MSTEAKKANGKDLSLLSAVYLSESVAQSCLAHALTTDREEIMGVLLGSIEIRDGVPPATSASSHSSPESPSPPSLRHATSLPLSTPDTRSKVAYIHSSFVMKRSVLRSDRVEIAAEVLIEAADEAERLSRTSGVPTRVIGWYHSHPRITPYPSAVDLRSQRTYQGMESGWVGLIMSVFHTDKANRNDCSIHCFQAGPEGSHVHVPLNIVPQHQVCKGKSIAFSDSNHKMIKVFKKELDVAVSELESVSGGDAMTMCAAHGMRDAQAYALERLLVEPTAKHLEWYSIPDLKAEVKRLEEALAASHSKPPVTTRK